MKNIGLGLLGLGAFGCVIYPLGYIPSRLYFISDKPGLTWGVLIGLVVIGGVVTWMGMKSEKSENQNQG